MKLKMRSSPDQKDFFFASCHAKVKLLLQTSTRVILKFSNNGNPVLRAHNAQVWDMALCSDWVNTLVQPYQEMIFNTKCLFLRLNELQVGLGCSQVWDPFFLKKCFLALMEKLTMEVSSIHKTKTAKITHLLRKRGGGGEITCIKSVLAHLTKVIPSISKMQSSPLLCHVPAARYSAPLETTVLYLSSECTDCEGTDLKKKRHLSQ